MFPKILRSLSSIAVFAAAVAFVSPVSLVAQSASSLVTTRITQPIDENSRVTLAGSVHPLANKANDRGAAPDSMPLDRITMFFKRSTTQETALKQLISDLHTPGSSSYHKWLTPDQFGKQFGPSDQDLATVQSWLSSHGFSVTKVNAGRQSIEFSGNVAQFRNTFHAQIHKYAVNGEIHYANADAPQIPTAMASVIGGFASLNNFRVKSYIRTLGKATYDQKTDKATPQWTIGSSAAGYSFVLSPGDYTVQYDLQPLYTAGINGSGQTIAIINESNINIYLVNQFRSLFGLPANPPQVIIDGNDPGVDGVNDPDGPNYASGEAYLDVEWSGAVAPNATIDLVIAGDTQIESGVTLALEHAIYGNLAPVVSLSFGLCESAVGSGNTFVNDLYAQGAAQGQTIIASTGDAGSAGCDDDNSQYYAVSGQAVSGFASTPYNVAVGGTDFYYSSWNQGSTAINNQLQTYWSSTNGNFNASNNTPVVSILGVIPEQPWNESQYGLDIINFYDATGQTATSIAGGGGGASNAAICSSGYNSNGACTGTLSGYPKPAWQTGTGVPSDGVRDIPDVSLFASSGINASYYPTCASDGDCQPVSSGGTVQITGVGGTSASAPSFAGIMALVNQKYGPQGQADYVLYPLFKQVPAAFHDVVNGTNSVPCAFSTSSSNNTPNCIAVANPITVTDPNLGPATEGQIGSGTTAEYNAGSGYDLATGLGTIDANQLVTNWGSVKFTSTTTTLTPSSTSFAHGTAVTISGSVTTSGGTPTGNVALVTDSTEPIQQGQSVSQLLAGNASTFALNSTGAYTGSVNYLPGGTYDIWGQYGGDGTNGPSTSQKTSITVSPESSGIYFNLYSPAGTNSTGTITSGASIDYGTQIELSARVAPSSQLAALPNCFPNTSAACPVFGMPTGTVAFTDGGSTINTAVINAEGDAEYNAPFGVGSHSVAASYSGDNSYNKSTATAVTFTVQKDTPQISFSAANMDSNGDFITGQPTVFNIEVVNGAAVNFASSSAFYPSPVAPPTGTITVSGLPGGSQNATLSPMVDPTVFGAAAIATVTIPATSQQTPTITISYAGDSNYNSTSENGQISILSASGLASTTTATVTGSISPSTTISVTGTVTGQSGHPAPTGTVYVYSSGNTSGPAGYLPAATLVAGSSDVSTFSLTFNSQSLVQGTNFITLQYTGDNVYANSAYQLSTSVSNPLSDFSMVPETTILSIPSSGSTTVPINISSTNSFAGTVSLTCSSTGGVGCSFDNASPSLTAGSTAAVNLTVNNNNVTTAKTYNVTVTGTDSTGQYVHTIGLAVVAPATTLTSGLNLTGPSGITIINPGDSGTGTLAVSAQGGLTGAVSFTCSVESSPTGITCSAPNATITSANATSTLTVATTSSAMAGSYTADVTAMLGTTTSAVVKVPITLNPAANFAITGTNITSLAPGATTGNTSTITVKPSGGFTGTVNMSCSLTSSPTGATNLPSCSLPSPSTVDITGTNAATITMTISSTAATSGALVRPLDKFFAVGGGITIAGLLLFGIPARRRSWRTILGVLVFATIVGFSIGCGGSGNGGGGGGGGGGSSGTTAGTYTFSVTGSSGSLTPVSTQVTVTFN